MGKALAPGGSGEDLAFGLLPEDWNHFEPMMLAALHRLPALETVIDTAMLNDHEAGSP